MRASLQILVLGGTRFVGRHIVECALARGHSVFAFNRGSTAKVFGEAVVGLVGDRRHDLSALSTLSHIDAVIDVCGYLPSEVAASTDALTSIADRYVFISTISVYETFDADEITEEAPLHKPGPADAVEVGANYGPLKVACENLVQERFAGRCAIVRPGLIVGPWDPTDRFTWWCHRGAQGGRTVVFPGRVQFIDARDLAAFVLRLVEKSGSAGPCASGANGQTEASSWASGPRASQKERLRTRSAGDSQKERLRTGSAGDSPATASRTDSAARRSQRNGAETDFGDSLGPPASHAPRADEPELFSVFNAVGPGEPTTTSDVVEIAASLADVDIELFTRTSTELAEAGVVPWAGLPLWVPETSRAIHRVSLDRAGAAGLTHRPVAETVRDTLRWVGEDRGDEPFALGLTREQEDELLA